VAYTTADRAHPGCLIGNVAPASDLPAVRRFLKANLKKTEARIEDLLAAAVRSGQLPADYSAADGARLAVNGMLSLGARARLGTARAALLADADAATATVLGSAEAQEVRQTRGRGSARPDRR
jgi:hypothetical protein